MVFLLSLSIGLSPAFGAATFRPAVMAPLQIGDPRQPEGSASITAWNQFRYLLQRAKQSRVEAITTDVWWGVVEPEDQQFHWVYYAKMAREIRAAGLRWIPELSFHRCGGNVGDNCDIPLPSWIWYKPVTETGPIRSPEDLKYRSEQGNTTTETVAVWATPYILHEYSQFMHAFQLQFAAEADIIEEIQISLGPAGELRYPSYNSHDFNTGYPHRGALQAYSDLAVRSFRMWLRARHGPDLQVLSRRWGFSVADWNHVYPPTDSGGRPPERFLTSRAHLSSYGQDFFAWYSESLVQHAHTLLREADSVFSNPTSPFRGIRLGAKLPGVHWRMASDRLAELAAGLLRTHDPAVWTKGADGVRPQSLGYRPILRAFQLPGLRSGPVHLHFTCLERDDFEESHLGSASLARSLVRWIAEDAHALAIPIFGENALGPALQHRRAWENMSAAIAAGAYRGLTLLRLEQFTDFGWIQLTQLVNQFRPRP